MATTDISICTTALLLVGANEIETFTDSTREARICDQLYQTTKQSLLQTHPWKFSLAFTELARTDLATTSSEYEFGYLYEYTLPPDFLRLIKKDGLQNDYRIVGSKLYSNDSDVHILYQYDVSETKFPAYFTRALEIKMAELLAAALIQDETQVQIWAGLSRQELIRAKNIDGTQSPPEGMQANNFALTAIRGQTT